MIMKKLLFFGTFLVALCVGFVSCGDDDEEGDGGNGGNPSYTYDTFNEPYMQWGATMAQVKNANKGKTVIGETEDAIIYVGEKKAAMEGYAFLNSKLYGSQVWLDVDAVEATEVVGFLDERYTAYDSEDTDGDGTDDVWVYVEQERDLAIALIVETMGEDVYYAITYMALSANASAPMMAAKAKASVTALPGMKRVLTGAQIEVLNAAFHK